MSGFNIKQYQIQIIICTRLKCRNQINAGYVMLTQKPLPISFQNAGETLELWTNVEY